MTESWVVYERKICFRIMAKKVVKLTNEEKYEKAIKESVLFD